jgi:hypothetical protein
MYVWQANYPGMIALTRLTYDASKNLVASGSGDLEISGNSLTLKYTGIVDDAAFFNLTDPATRQEYPIGISLRYYKGFQTNG